VDDGRTGSGKQASKEKERLVKKGRVEKKNKTTQIETKTVIFVPQTANSLLAKMLRQEESHLEKVTGYRVKYVEKAGQNIGSLLVRSNPWSGIDCGRRGCLLCETKAKTGKTRPGATVVRKGMKKEKLRKINRKHHCLHM
jgi:hypothetical protein